MFSIIVRFGGKSGLCLPSSRSFPEYTREAPSGTISGELHGRLRNKSKDK
jgi:hypothetical protein